MSTRYLIALAALGGTAAFAQDPQSPVAEGPQSMVPGFDASRIVYSQSGDMDLQDDEGSLEVTDLAVRSFLCQPVRPIEGLYVLPEASYRFTHLNIDGQAGPLQDEDLHSLALSLYVLGMPAGSPWIYGAWARAELATDFDVINGDDFSFDLAGGVGYRFNDSFTFGVGAAVTNLNGYPSFYPGIGFDWVASEKLRIGIYGPTAVAAYALNEYWLFTLRFDFSGGVWNVEDRNGQSQSVDLSDNRLGLYASRRLTENLWLTAGAGLTIANELDYTTPAGHGIYSSDLDTAPFGVISLRVKAW
jgi:hypothetical protein